MNKWIAEDELEKLKGVRKMKFWFLRGTCSPKASFTHLYCKIDTVLRKVNTCTAHEIVVDGLFTVPYQYHLNGTSAWKKGSERRVTFGHLVLLIKAVGWDDADHKNLEYYTLLQLHVDSFKIQNVVVSETKEFLDGWKWDWNIGAACITWSVLWYYIITLSVVGRGAELHEADNNCLFMSIDFQITSVFSEI